MYRFLLAIFFVLSTTRSQSPTPKFCVNCKHYIPCTVTGLAEYGKCAAFGVTTPRDNKYLVTGIDDNGVVFEPYYCSNVRRNHDMCGKDGKTYVKKTIV